MPLTWNTARRKRRARTVAASGPPAAVGFTLSISGPSWVYPGKAAILVVTPAAATTDTVHFSDGGHGGAWSPASAALSWSGAATPQQITYTQATAGTYALAATSAAGGAIAGGTPSLVVKAAPPRRRGRWFPGLARR